MGRTPITRLLNSRFEPRGNNELHPISAKPPKKRPSNRKAQALFQNRNCRQPVSELNPRTILSRPMWIKATATKARLKVQISRWMRIVVFYSESRQTIRIWQTNIEFSATIDKIRFGIGWRGSGKLMKIYFVWQQRIFGSKPMIKN